MEKEKRICTNCINGPEKFSGAIMPLNECYKQGYHVHKNGNGYAVFAEDKKVFSWVGR